jgi:hypothetical protein
MTLRCGASAAAILAAAVLAGCGEEKPADVARAYVATNKPEKCGMLTQGLLEQLTGRQGDAARAACRRNVVRFAAPNDVRVRGGEGEEGDGEENEEAGEAEVELVVDGHPADVKLVRHGEHWLIAGMGD